LREFFAILAQLFFLG